MSLGPHNVELSLSKNSQNVEVGLKEAKDDEEICTKSRTLTSTKRILLHVSLFGIVAGYLAIGAVAFSSMEISAENEAKDSVLKDKQNTIKSIYNLVNNYSNVTNQTILEILNNFTEVVNYASDFGLDLITIGTDKEKPKWSLLGGYFFSFSLITTVGYGNLAPKTEGGRLFCIFYSLIGIPLMFLCLADLGSILAGFLRFICFKLFPILKKKLSKKKQFLWNISKKKKNGQVINMEMTQKSTNETSANQNNSISLSKRTISSTKSSKTIDFPIILVLLVVFLYTSLLSLYISHYQGWDFFASFYFSFITLTTIGLGDVLPKYGIDHIIQSTFLVLLGMVVVSACFNLVQHKVRDAIYVPLVKMGVLKAPEKQSTGR